MSVDPFARYVEERPLYERTCQAAIRLIKQRLGEEGILAQVDGRAKEHDSLVKKCIRKAKGYDDVQDKAGVRVRLAYPDDRLKAVTAVASTFEVLENDDKASKLNETVFTYAGHHLLVRVDETKLICEVQVHTPGVALWSGLSHDLTYKAPPHLPEDAKRSINRLMALCEIVDLEAARVRKMIEDAEDAVAGRVLLSLEKHFLRLAREPYDEELSLLLLDELLPILPSTELPNVDSIVSAFCRERDADLKHIFEKKRDPVRYPLLLQPEAILIFYLLSVNEFALEEHWPARLAPEELRSFKTLWGLS